MNNYRGGERIRSRSLLIVEGHHEKNNLFCLIFKFFPEININMDEIWIYGTNIYQLYNDIVKEYGEGWAEGNEDIDLPFVISKKQYPDNLRYKEDFTNIILVFDYERHDTNFSEEKILGMQRCFVDAADMGRLYINYPMIESYRHLCQLPDDDFAERKILVSLQPGKKYKAIVEGEAILGSKVDFPHKIDDLLEKHFGVSIDNALREVVAEHILPTAKYQLVDWVTRQEYIHTNLTYWKYIRGILKQIIYHNISKANRIQYGQYQIPDNNYKEYFERLDLTEILKVQNLASKDNITGFIWVLNTCIYFIAEYNFRLVMD